MKKTKILTQSDKKKLHEFYYSNSWEALSKLLKNQKENIKNLSLLSESMEDLKFHKGQIHQIIWLENQLLLNSRAVKTEQERKAKERKAKV